MNFQNKKHVFFENIRVRIFVMISYKDYILINMPKFMITRYIKASVSLTEHEGREKKQFVLNTTTENRFKDFTRGKRERCHYDGHSD